MIHTNITCGSDFFLLSAAETALSDSASPMPPSADRWRCRCPSVRRSGVRSAHRQCGRTSPMYRRLFLPPFFSLRWIQARVILRVHDGSGDRSEMSGGMALRPGRGRLDLFLGKEPLEIPRRQHGFTSLPIIRPGWTI